MLVSIWLLMMTYQKKKTIGDLDTPALDLLYIVCSRPGKGILEDRLFSDAVC